MNPTKQRTAFNRLSKAGGNAGYGLLCLNASKGGRTAASVFDWSYSSCHPGRFFSVYVQSGFINESRKGQQFNFVGSGSEAFNALSRQP